MFCDFKEEALLKLQFVLKISRHKVFGGWYVRALFTEMGFGTGARNEAAVFIEDAEHAWQIGDFSWEQIGKEPGGGIYRVAIIGGWLVLSTARGESKTEDGVKFKTRPGSLVFIPDGQHSWQCDVQP